MHPRCNRLSVAEDKYRFVGENQQNGSSLKWIYNASFTKRKPLYYALTRIRTKFRAQLARWTLNIWGREEADY